MIRNLLATTALATLVATGAYAQNTTAPAAPATPMVQEAPAEAVMPAEGHLATKIIGENVYNGTGQDAEKIGDVNDFVLSPDGQIEAVVVGVGGFLGIGEKNVAVNFEEMQWVDRDGDRWLVMATTKEQLEQLEAFDPAPYELAPATVAGTDPNMPADQSSDNTAMAPATQPAEGESTTATAEAPAQPAERESSTATAEAPAQPAEGESTTATAEAPAQPAEGESSTETADAPAAAPAEGESNTQTAVVPVTPPAEGQSTTETADAPADSNAAPTDTTTTAAIDRSQLTDVPMDQIRAEDLIGTTVYGANDENIGEIGDVVLTSDGKIDAYIIDVGGFLGMGEKEVAIGSDNLTFMSDQNDNMYLYTSFTKEQLDAAPTYDESNWAEKRDEQRLTVTR
jgi:sporulation protein YlmC with PRC-barrel domain